MGNAVAEQRVLSYLKAFYSGDLETALSFCDDDIDFVSYAPIEIFPHLGHKRGKAALGASMATTLRHYLTMRYDVSFIVSDGDKVAVMLRLHRRKMNSERIIQLDHGQFYTLRNGRIAEMRSFFDSFDAIQQILEHDLTSAFASPVQSAWGA